MLITETQVTHTHTYRVIESIAALPNITLKRVSAVTNTGVIS